MVEKRRKRENLGKSENSFIEVQEMHTQMSLTSVIIFKRIHSGGSSAVKQMHF